MLKSQNPSTELPVKIDNTETLQVLEKLENLEDQELAIKLLKQLNDKTSELGKFIVNRDPELDHGTWKIKCDQLQNEVDMLIADIMSH